MVCGPFGPVLSMVISMLLLPSRFMLMVLLRSLHSLSTTASSAVSLSSLVLQLDSAFAFSLFTWSIRLSVHTVIVMPLAAGRPLASSISICQRPFCPCMPLNIFGTGMSWAMAQVARASAATAAGIVLMAFLIRRIYTPRVILRRRTHETPAARCSVRRVRRRECRLSGKADQPDRRLLSRRRHRPDRARDRALPREIPRRRRAHGDRAPPRRRRRDRLRRDRQRPG